MFPASGYKWEPHGFLQDRAPVCSLYAPGKKACLLPGFIVWILAQIHPSSLGFRKAAGHEEAREDRWLAGDLWDQTHLFPAPCPWVHGPFLQSLPTMGDTCHLYQGGQIWLCS